MIGRIEEILLSRPDPGVPWGFRLQGGSEQGGPLCVQRVFSGSPSDGVLQRDDVIVAIDGSDVTRWSLTQAQDKIKMATTSVYLSIKRSGSSPKPDNFQAQPFSVQSSPQNFQSPPQQNTPHNTAYLSPSSIIGIKTPAAPTAAKFSTWSPNETPRGPVASVEPVQNYSSWKPELNDTPLRDFENQHGHMPTNPAHQPIQQQYYQKQPQHLQPLHQQQQQHQQQQPQHHQQPHQQHPQQQLENEEEDDAHLSVRDIKSLFNQGQNPQRQMRDPSQSRPKPNQYPKKQPRAPEPEIQPPKNVPVYQQKSSYNPLEFQGVNKPTKLVNRPPGLVQRGAPLESAPVEKVRAPQPPSGDPLTDFYLHGFNAKVDAPSILSNLQSTDHGGSRRLLPPRTNEPLIKPITPSKKKEFNPNQSSVLRALESESKPEGGGRKPHQGPPPPQQRGNRHPQQVSAVQPAAGSRLAELLQQDEEKLAPYKEMEEYERGNNGAYPHQSAQQQSNQRYQGHQDHQGHQGQQGHQGHQGHQGQHGHQHHGNQGYHSNQNNQGYHGSHGNQDAPHYSDDRVSHRSQQVIQLSQQAPSHAPEAVSRRNVNVMNERGGQGFGFGSSQPMYGDLPCSDF